MGNYKIAVCDDEKYVTEIISKYLQEYYGEKCQVFSFGSGEELLDSGEKFDIAFLDIEMGNLNGIHLAEKLKDFNSKINIIFITNYTKYWKQAFHVHAFEYLEKPVLRKELFHVLDEVERNRKNDVQETVVRLKSQEGIIQVKLSEIIYFEYCMRKVKMVLEGKEYLLTYSMQDIEKLVHSCDFARPHRAYIVNLRRIDRITKCDIFMSNGAAVPLAQKKAAEFKRQFDIYLYSYEKR